MNFKSFLDIEKAAVCDSSFGYSGHSLNSHSNLSPHIKALYSKNNEAVNVDLNVSLNGSAGNLKLQFNTPLIPA